MEPGRPRRSAVGGVRLATNAGSVRLRGWHRGVLRAVRLRAVPGLYLVLPDHRRDRPRECRPLAGARARVCRRKRRLLRGGWRGHRPRGGRHLPVFDRDEAGGRHQRRITRTRARRRHPTAVHHVPIRASRRAVTSGGRAVLLRVRVRPGVDGLHAAHLRFHHRATADKRLRRSGAGDVRDLRRGHGVDDASHEPPRRAGQAECASPAPRPRPSGSSG